MCLDYHSEEKIVLSEISRAPIYRKLFILLYTDSIEFYHEFETNANKEWNWQLPDRLTRDSFSLRLIFL